MEQVISGYKLDSQREFFHLPTKTNFGEWSKIYPRRNKRSCWNNVSGCKFSFLPNCFQSNICSDESLITVFLLISIFNYALTSLKAGDTTSTALNFLFVMLAMHENVQKRIVEEVDEVFGENKDLIIDHEKLSQLKYVEQCIKETLRLFSPATGKLI